ncbi:multiple epidermal growth factor-like domains protein 10 [Mercenaria mercenaria]|uniref:multiple epidermal growth factor-like domains protein 10 n=1 Tax=Mercenaria mercenaria TaxID=6596 RepID=UPI00234E5E04|nr:multiple epidermal growth factor-like domains protein 10 [Mercenaria mercenaria]
MEWLNKTVWSLYILRWIWFYSRFPVEGVVHDLDCYDNCNCCKNGKCHTEFGWPNVCSDGCIDRHRAARCYELCTYNCVSCRDNADICTGCFEGFYLGPNKDCTSECPTKCRACTSDTMCTVCKAGYYDKDGSTTCLYSVCPANCKCSGNTCSTCKNGFYDTGSECSKRCPFNCMSCVSKDICNECKHGFYNGYEFDNNNRQLSSNCTFKCRDSCTECQSYDKCLQCLKGKYGPTCQNNCSIGCKGQTCHIESGKCSCSLNFDGDKCTDCVNGKYGTYCNETCPELCKNSKCNKTSGHCSEGCVTNTITGTTCNTCTVGMYGILCNNICPSNCKDKTCNRTTGFCSEGCESNFKGPFCDTCIQGKYGVACNQDCSLKCENALCEKETGKCVSCTGNFDGNRCENCQPGFHGQNCYDSCSTHCYNTTCGISTGVCDYGCTYNYSGDMCCMPNANCVKCASKTECKECKSGYFNYLCMALCPSNCLDSCDISTGVCRECIINRFGPFCNRKCSENCSASRSGDKRDCTSVDGMCTFGCKDGFYGITCDKKCSDLCIGYICNQDSGICEKGCGGSNDDPVCVLDFRKREVTSDDNSTATTTNIVLATLLALTTTALCISIVWIIVSKKRSTDRQTENSSFQISLDHSLVVNQAPQNEVFEADNAAYEILDRTQGAPEHTYDTASASAPKSITDPGNTDYMNLNRSYVAGISRQLGFEWDVCGANLLASRCFFQIETALQDVEWCLFLRYTLICLCNIRLLYMLSQATVPSAKTEDSCLAVPV